MEWIVFVVVFLLKEKKGEGGIGGSVLRMRRHLFATRVERRNSTIVDTGGQTKGLEMRGSAKLFCRGETSGSFRRLCDTPPPTFNHLIVLIYPRCPEQNIACARRLQCWSWVSLTHSIN